ncbi:MAG: ribosome recycling factor [Acidimicrobiia bacterium]|nr:ribosome recycling factor [Acidimicrobiia bacterium]MDX2467736.1 ribosome recycling factor [Acidimicrobiia bacterium]
MIDEQLAEAKGKMDQAISHTIDEFGTVRTGRANPGLLHRIVVDYYGTQTPLQQIAGFSVPEARMLVVQPYDKSSIQAIEKAIMTADLGLNPSNDGNVIRLAFPQLTEERRKELIRMVRHLAEDGRVAVRNVRRHIKDDIESLEGDVSEDDVRRAEKTLQEMTDRHVHKIDDLLANKEEELMEV